MAKGQQFSMLLCPVLLGSLGTPLSLSFSICKMGKSSHSFLTHSPVERSKAHKWERVLKPSPSLSPQATWCRRSTLTRKVSALYRDLWVPSGGAGLWREEGRGRGGERRGRNIVYLTELLGQGRSEGAVSSRDGGKQGFRSLSV